MTSSSSKTANHQQVLVKYGVSHPDQKQTLVFLHGFGGNMGVWHDLLNQFPTYKCIYIDLRGHGHSPRSKDVNFYQISNFVEDINQVLLKEKVGSCVLVGHCFGGMLAIEFVKKYPNKVTKLVLFNAADSLPKIAYNKIVSKLLTWHLKYLSKLIPDIGFDSYPDPKKYVDSSDYDIPRIAADITHTHLHSYFTTLAQTAKHNFTISKDNQFPPTVVVQGSNDQVVDRQLTIALYEKLPQAKLITLNTGHITPISDLQKMGPIIQNALDGKYEYRTKKI